MWSTIPTPCLMPISAARSSSSTNPSRSPFSATGTPASNVTSTISGSSGASSGRVTSWKTSSSGACDRSSIHLPSDERPQRLSSIEYGAVSVPPLTGIPCLRAYAISSSRPICHERTGAITFSSGPQRRDRGLDPHLVVALARAAVGDRVAAGLARVLDRELRDQRPPQRREQRIAVAVVGVGLDRRQDVLACELLARVDHVAVQGAELQRLALDDVVVLPRLPEVDGQGHDLGLVLVLDPLEHHARVQAARVEQQHAPDFTGLGQVAGDARRVRVGDAVDFGMGAGISRLLVHGETAYEPRSVSVAWPRDGALVAEALAVVGLLVADVLRAVARRRGRRAASGRRRGPCGPRPRRTGARCRARGSPRCGGAAPARRAPRAGRPPAPATPRPAPARSPRRSPSARPARPCAR